MVTVKNCLYIFRYIAGKVWMHPPEAPNQVRRAWLLGISPQTKLRETNLALLQTIHPWQPPGRMRGVVAMATHQDGRQGWDQSQESYYVECCWMLLDSSTVQWDQHLRHDTKIELFQTNNDKTHHWDSHSIYSEKRWRDVNNKEFASHTLLHKHIIWWLPAFGAYVVFTHLCKIYRPHPWSIWPMPAREMDSWLVIPTSPI